MAAQTIPALRLLQNDWLENVAGHPRADAHQGESVLSVPNLLLQLINRQSKLCAGEGVGEDKGSIALLGKHYVSGALSAYYYHVQRSRYEASQPQLHQTLNRGPRRLLLYFSVSG